MVSNAGGASVAQSMPAADTVAYGWITIGLALTHWSRCGPATIQTRAEHEAEKTAATPNTRLDQGQKNPYERISGR